MRIHNHHANEYDQIPICLVYSKLGLNLLLVMCSISQQIKAAQTQISAFNYPMLLIRKHPEVTSANYFIRLISLESNYKSAFHYVCGHKRMKSRYTPTLFIPSM